jgi:hypothetical protein
VEQDLLSVVLWRCTNGVPIAHVRLEDVASVSTHFAKPEGCCFAITLQVVVRPTKERARERERRGTS